MGEVWDKLTTFCFRNRTKNSTKRYGDIDGFSSEPNTCRALKGGVVTEAQGILNLWSERFSGLLNETDFLLPDYEEVLITITHLKYITVV